MSTSRATLCRIVARGGLIVSTIALTGAALTLFLSAITPSHAERSPAEDQPRAVEHLMPPSLYVVAPRLIAAGAGAMRLGIQGSLHHDASSVVAHWNGYPLSTTRVAPSAINPSAFGPAIYEAIVPAELISSTGHAFVTLRNAYGNSAAARVVITDTPLSSPPPLLVAISAAPGELSNSTLSNTVRMTVTDQLGAPAGTDTSVMWDTSEGWLFSLWPPPPQPGVFMAQHIYAPGLGRVVTPVVTIAGHVFAPSAYATAVVTFTGTITRELVHLPWISRVEPTSAPPLTPTLGPIATPGFVSITTIRYQGDPSLNEADEYVEIHNGGTTQIDLSNWMLRAFVGNQQSDSFVFSSGFIMAGGQTCRIYTNLPSGPDNCGLTDGFGRDEPLWPNTGGASARLYNAQNIEVARYTY